MEKHAAGSAIREPVIKLVASESPSQKGKRFGEKLTNVTPH